MFNTTSNWSSWPLFLFLSGIMATIAHHRIHRVAGKPAVDRWFASSIWKQATKQVWKIITEVKTPRWCHTDNDPLNTSNKEASLYWKSGTYQNSANSQRFDTNKVYSPPPRTPHAAIGDTFIRTIATISLGSFSWSHHLQKLEFFGPVQRVGQESNVTHPNGCDTVTKTIKREGHKWTSYSGRVWWVSHEKIYARHFTIRDSRFAIRKEVPTSWT